MWAFTVASLYSTDQLVPLAVFLHIVVAFALFVMYCWIPRRNLRKISKDSVDFEPVDLVTSALPRRQTISKSLHPVWDLAAEPKTSRSSLTREPSTFVNSWGEDDVNVLKLLASKQEVVESSSDEEEVVETERPIVSPQLPRTISFVQRSADPYATSDNPPPVKLEQLEVQTPAVSTEVVPVRQAESSSELLPRKLSFFSQRNVEADMQEQTLDESNIHEDRTNRATLYVDKNDLPSTSISVFDPSDLPAYEDLPFTQLDPANKLAREQAAVLDITRKKNRDYENADMFTTENSSLIVSHENKRLSILPTANVVFEQSSGLPKLENDLTTTNDHESEQNFNGDETSTNLSAQEPETGGSESLMTTTTTTITLPPAYSLEESTSEVTSVTLSAKEAQEREAVLRIAREKMSQASLATSSSRPNFDEPDEMLMRHELTSVSERPSTSISSTTPSRKTSHMVAPTSLNEDINSDIE